MIQPMPEAYAAAGQAYDAALEDEGWSAPVAMYLEVNRAGLAAVVDAVWPLAADDGYRRAVQALRDETAASVIFESSRLNDHESAVVAKALADHLEAAAAPRNEGAQT